MPVHLTCSTCGKALTRNPSKARLAHAYCSSSCSGVGQRKSLGGDVEVLPDGTARIPLRAKDGSLKAYALIDATDAEWANQWRWHCDSRGYAARCQSTNGRVKQYLLHRELLGLVRDDGKDVDHINRDRLNNRRANLRVILPGEQPQNVPANCGSSSPYRGVSLSLTTGKWSARVQFQRREYLLGLFDSEEEAAEVARAERMRLMPYAID